MGRFGRPLAPRPRIPARVPVSSYFRRVLGVGIPRSKGRQVRDPLKSSRPDWPVSRLGSSLSIPPQPHPVRFGGLFAVGGARRARALAETSPDPVGIEFWPAGFVDLDQPGSPGQHKPRQLGCRPAGARDFLRLGWPGGSCWSLAGSNFLSCPALRRIRHPMGCCNLAELATTASTARLCGSSCLQAAAALQSIVDSR